MVKMYKKDFHSFENFTKYEELIDPITNKIYFEEDSIDDIKKDVFTNESIIFYG